MSKKLATIMAMIAFLSASLLSSQTYAYQRKNSLISSETPPNGGDGEFNPQPEPLPDPQLGARLIPAFYLDFDFGEKIFNLTPHDPEKADPSLVKHNYDASKDTLVYKDFENGFEVVKYSNIEGGIGIGAEFFFRNAVGLPASFWAGIGIIPIKGKAASETRHVQTLDDAENLKRISRIPEAQEILNWRTEDSLTYESSGGIVSFIGAGFGYVGVDITKITRGTFKVYIEKQDSTHALVKVSDMISGNTSSCFVAGIISLCKDKSKEHNNPDGLDSIMSFNIDLSTEVGQQAYSDLVNGNVAGIQILALNRNSSVAFQEKSTISQVSRSINAFIGIPSLLYYSWSKGKTYEVSSTFDVNENTQVDAKYGIYIKELTGRAFNRHSNQVESFYGGYATISNPISAKELMTEQIGQYIISVSRDHTEPGKLSNAFKLINLKTGLDNFVIYNIPTIDDLEYSNAELTVTFDSERTQKLIGNIFRVLGPKTSTKFSNERLDKYTTKYDLSKFEICSEKNISPYSSTCRNEVLKQTSSATDEMYDAISKMAWAKSHDDQKAFVTAYADFGKAMLTNQLTFNTAIDLAGPGVMVAYTIESTYFSKVHNEYTTTDEEGVLLPTNPKFQILSQK